MGSRAIILYGIPDEEPNRHLFKGRKATSRTAPHPGGKGGASGVVPQRTARCRIRWYQGSRRPPQASAGPWASKGSEGGIRSSLAEGCPVGSRNFIRFNNISNIVRYLYEKPSHNNRKCGCRWHTGLSDQDWPCPYMLHGVYSFKDRGSRPHWTHSYL